MQYFRIRLKAKNPEGKSLYLRVDNQGKTTLTSSPNENDRWIITCLIIDKNFYDRQIVNPATGRIICAPKNDQPTLGLPSLEIIDKRSTWNIFSRVDIDGVIQLNRDQDMSLNALGSGPYVDGTPVYAWKWQGGNPNELWALEAA